MKSLLRKIFSPILNFFENGDDEGLKYQSMHRKITLFIGITFSGLTGLVLYLLPSDGDPGYYIPVVVFSLIALVSLVVGFLGTDRAVAKIWNNKT